MLRIAAVAGACVTLATACTTTSSSGPGPNDVLVQPLPVPTVSVMHRFGCTGCSAPRASRSKNPAPRPQAVHNPVHKHHRKTIYRPTAPAPATVTTPGPTSHDVGALHDITMYCDHGIMADGHQTHFGVVATIRRDIPFGTTVVIKGLGTYVVEDRIGNGSEFDVWTPACSTANDFGRHRLRVQTTN